MHNNLNLESFYLDDFETKACLIICIQLEANFVIIHLVPYNIRWQIMNQIENYCQLLEKYTASRVKIQALWYNSHIQILNQKSEPVDK